MDDPAPFDPCDGLSHPRYTARPFPPYRFLPGRNPHPTAHPQGHSHRPPGEVEPHPAVLPAGRWRECEEYLYGCDLYNHAYWWEAHEAWEGLWKQCAKDDPRRWFLQGLIQAAATHVQIALNRRSGYEHLREKSLMQLRRVEAAAGGKPFMGLEVAAYVESLEQYFQVCGVEGGDLRHHPGRFPCLRLEG